MASADRFFASGGAETFVVSIRQYSRHADSRDLRDDLINMACEGPAIGWYKRSEVCGLADTFVLLIHFGCSALIRWSNSIGRTTLSGFDLRPAYSVKKLKIARSASYQNGNRNSNRRRTRDDAIGFVGWRRGLTGGFWSPDGAYSRFISPLLCVLWALVMSRVLISTSPALTAGW